jgi:glycosyltransferase involved in cell wall biosynthesis
MAITGYETPLAYAEAALRLARMSRSAEHNYALVHAHGGEVGIAASMYRRAPLLVSYQGSDLLGSPGPDGRTAVAWRLRSAVVRQHARLTAATVTKSAPMEPRLPPRVRANNRVIPNGVNRDQFKPRDRSAARADLGWDDDERVALFASDPARASKRLALARAACEQAAEQTGPIRLHVAHGLPPEVMPDLMNASDCLLHPSASEGSPNVVKEALACNLPVVATPVGDIPELLAGVEYCWISEPQREEIAAALSQCLMTPRRSNGRALSEALDERRIAERIAALYVEVAGKRIYG